MSQSNQYQYQIFNIKTVIEITGISRSTIYEIIDPKSSYYDPNFPKPISLTKNRIGWVSKEIYDWIESKIAQRKK
ncbi:AlpA family phage regulatory protein [Acinetobacter junii]|uniref:AlpA family phage regulatory protein n=1 Tax=Acinetobacter junii TaxID=40215 RepID=A0AAX1ML27_ACIJU|nr:AlpA family phage regulatory protein [Acinetobacter junii]QUY37611.1 AlpA family phage regulatory protein [Acinetobacter junii]